VNEYYRGIVNDAKALMQRFVDDEPRNAIEQALFHLIRQIGEAIADMLQGFLDGLRGTRLEAVT
jgi:hypothetical protein